MEIKICVGTTCHLMGGSILSQMIKDHKLYKEGKIKLEYATCFGECQNSYQAPMIKINGILYDDMNTDKLEKILTEKEGVFNE